MDHIEEKILKIRKDIPTKPMEVNVESTGIARGEPVFFDTADRQQTTKELWEREEARNAIPIDPPATHCRVNMQMTYTKAQQL